MLWLKPTEEEVKRSYERDAEPDHSRYYVHGSPQDRNYPALSYFHMIVPIAVPQEAGDRPFLLSEKDGDKEQAPLQQQVSYACDLCSATFRSDGELSTHVQSQH